MGINLAWQRSEGLCTKELNCASQKVTVWTVGVLCVVVQEFPLHAKDLKYTSFALHLSLSSTRHSSGERERNVANGRDGKGIV